MLPIQWAISLATLWGLLAHSDANQPTMGHIGWDRRFPGSLASTDRLESNASSVNFHRQKELPNGLVLCQHLILGISRMALTTTPAIKLLAKSQRLIYSTLVPSVDKALEEQLHETAAPQFKIVTRIYLDQARQRPVTLNQTLFTGTHVYDLMYEPDELQPTIVSILECRTRSFLLLDTQRKVKLKLENLQLLRIMEGMRQELLANEQTSFLVVDEFLESFDPHQNSIHLSSPEITYTVVGVRPVDDRILASFLEFLENYTLLAATNPSQMPPFPRMHLNRRLKKFGFVPTQVDLTVSSSEFGKFNVQATSFHELQTVLSQNDRNQIEIINKQWSTTYREVDLYEFRSISPDSDRGSQSDEKVARRKQGR